MPENTPEDLAAHVVAAAPHGHAQPADAVDGCDPELLAWWHTWEHTPRRGWPTGQKHAHDEFTAKREGVPHATVRAHCDRHDRHTLDCAACTEAVERSVQEAVDA